MSTEDLLRKGIAAANSGDKETAHTLLAKVVLADPTSEQAWLILSDCVPDLIQREQCLRKVLEINPSNKIAQQLLQETRSQSQSSNPEESIAKSQKLSEKEHPTDSPKLSFAINKINHTFENFGALGISIIGMLIAIIIVGIPTYLLVRSIEPPDFVIQIAQALVPNPDFDESAPTLDQIATSVPSQIPPSTVPPTETPSSSTYPGEDFANRFLQIYGDLLQAERYMDNGDYALAVLELDNIIKVVPDYGHAYFLRALSYQRMNYNQRSLKDYMDNVNSAYADINMAIDIGPIRGDYYLQRARITHDFTTDEDFFWDTWPWKELGLKDTLSATQLGSSSTFTNTDPGFYLIGLNRCKEALDFYSGFLEAQDPGIPTRATVHHGLSGSYNCLGDYEKALEEIDIALDLERSSTGSRHRREILFNLGRYSEVLEELSRSIEAYPSYSGTRYYFRALLYYQMGETELAKQDLQIGVKNTWDRYGFRAYVLGQIALDEGDEESALQWLQLAEASITPYHYPDFHKSLQGQIESLGGEPVTFYQDWVPSTPLSDIPIIPDQDFGPPTPSEPVRSYTLANYSGTGVNYIKGGDAIIFLFRPNEIVQIAEAQTLTLSIEGGVLDEETTLQISYLSTDEGWGGVETLIWGENEIPNPARYVNPQGYIFISIKNIGVDPVLLINCSVHLVATNADGTQTGYGFR